MRGRCGVAISWLVLLNRKRRANFRYAGVLAREKPGNYREQLARLEGEPQTNPGPTLEQLHRRGIYIDADVDRTGEPCPLEPVVQIGGCSGIRGGRGQSGPQGLDEDSRRCVALAVNLTGGGSYPVLSPAYLYKVQHNKKLLSDSGAANVAAPVFHEIAVGYADVDRTGRVLSRPLPGVPLRYPHCPRPLGGNGILVPQSGHCLSHFRVPGKLLCPQGHSTGVAGPG